MVTRIRQLLEYKQLSPTQFADLIGVGRPVMSHILSERNKPSLEVVKQMSSAFPDISLPWLLFGAGEMLAAEVASPSVTPSSAAPPLAGELPAEPAFQAEAITAPFIEAAAPVTVPPLPQPAVPRPFSASQPAPTSVAPAPALVPEATPAPAWLPKAPAMAPAAVPAAPQPFRVARFMPTTTSGPAAANPGLRSASAASSAPGAAQAASMPSLPAIPPATGPLTNSADSAALLPFLTESGKPIRRIVIFYRDGSFADYQPE